MDKYDKQIADIEAGSGGHSVALKMDWLMGIGLFAFINPTGSFQGYRECGCLTMIKMGRGVAIGKDGKTNEKLTTAIRDDKRIPITSGCITLESLQVFAEWQRRIDKELRNG